MAFNILKKYRHIERYREIIQVLIKNGLGFFVSRLELDRFLPLTERIKREPNLNIKNLPETLRKVLQELGPTYIKFGQLLSTRADILPPEYIKELRKLQDKVSPINFDKILTVIKEELGENYQEIFINIDENPVAAASIAQTHQALLKDGTQVILKIQRPGIKRTIQVDLDILNYLVSSTRIKNIFPEYIDISALIKEFGRTLLKELDFKMEVSNIEKFRENFRHESNIIVPEVYKELSSKRIIVMEEIKGVKLNKIEEISLNNSERRFLASLGAEVFLKQVLIDGFFHADPHPGNIFVLNRTKLAYIDFGMMGQLTSEDKDILGLLFLAAIKRDVNIIVDLILEIGSVKGELNKRDLKLEVQNFIDRYYGVELRQIDFKEIIDEIQGILYKHHILLPSEFYLLGRAIAINEGVGFAIDPSFSPMEVGKKFSKKLLHEIFRPDRIIDRFFDALWNIKHSTKGFPDKISKIFDKLINDNFSINFKHQNLERLINKIDIISNRLSISLIISALIIGSSMILQTKMQPQIFGIPLLGFIGYIIAGMLGFSLVIAIIRSGRF